MSRRLDGYWELFATASGNQEAVAKTIVGLSGQALAANTTGAAVSPSVVDLRIQALAAYSVTLLAQVSRQWKEPRDLGTDLMDPEVDFWTTAWCSSLRFLKAIGRVPDLEDPLPFALRKEREILFETDRLDVKAWAEVLAAVSNAKDYDQLRRFDAAQFALSKPINEAQLAELLRAEDPGVNALERLRVVRMHTSLLSASAREYLLDLLQARWRGPMSTIGLGGLAILMELVLDVHGDAETAADLASRLIAMLRVAANPEVYAPFAYLLLRTGWRLP